MNYFRNGQTLSNAGAEMTKLSNGVAGVFETLRLSRGRPLFWSGHWGRFEAGAYAHGFAPLVTTELLLRFAETLIAENKVRDGILRYAAWRDVMDVLVWPLEISQPAATDHAETRSAGHLGSGGGLAPTSRTSI